MRAGVWAGALLLAAGPGAVAESAASPATSLLRLGGVEVLWLAQPGRPDPVVTYAFAQRMHSFPQAINSRQLKPILPALAGSGIDGAHLRSEARAAFDMWQSAARISFLETGDEAAADILIGAQSEPRGYAFTDVFHDQGAAPRAGIHKSLIALNPERRWKLGFDGDLTAYDLRYTLAHEIGHAIGLDHPGPAGQIMSYRYDERLRELQPGDRAGAVQLYGARDVAKDSPASIGIATSPTPDDPAAADDGGAFEGRASRALR